MTDAETRPGAPLPEQEFTLTIEEVAVLYERAGFPRPIRRIQKYCARGDLDCRKVETLSGQKYLITAQSVERHIALIAQTQGASGHGQARLDAPERTEEQGDEIASSVATPPDAPARPGAPAVSDLSVFEHPYVKRLEREVEEFKSKFETQVRRTEQVLETANHNLIELQQASAIANSETLAKYMLASTGRGPKPEERRSATVADADASAANEAVSPQP